MSSLREEISQWYFECFQDWKNKGIGYYDKDTADVLVDEALAKIERRIDEIKKQYMKYYAVPDLTNEIMEMLKKK